MNKDEMKKVYDDRTCLRCGDYVAIDGNHIDISATCELIETILENKLDGAV